MNTAVVTRARPLSRLAAPENATAVSLAITAGLVLVSIVLRTRALRAGFWIDEGLSVGIASHPLFSIPNLLHQDGSPPLYYMLLHVWLRLFGNGEAATHTLSVLFAVATIPVGLFGGWSLFGRRAGVITACLLALNPFITLYADETRMYALVMVLALAATVAFCHAFVLGHRRYLFAFSGLLALLCYTHAWGVFFGAGSVAAFAFCLWQSPQRRAILRDGALSFGGAALLFAPWLPLAAYQAHHNAAPWVNSPRLGAPVQIANTVFGGQRTTVAILLGAGAGFFSRARIRSRERTMVIATLVLVLGTLAVAWTYSQLSPAWTTRYLAAVVGPIMLLIGVGLARARWLGLAALAIIAVLWFEPLTGALEHKSNVRDLAAQANPSLTAGDLVVSTHPEEVPVLYYYLRPGLSFASTLGPTADPRVMDWRDAVSRLQTSTPASELEPLLATLPPGHRVLLVRPMTTTNQEWNAPWTELVRRRSAEWGQALASDPRFTASSTYPTFFSDVSPSNGVRAVLYTKVGR